MKLAMKMMNEIKVLELKKFKILVSNFFIRIKIIIIKIYIISI